MAAQLAKTLPKTETDFAAYKYYVLRRYDGEFKIIYMDAESAELWKAAGWEFRAHDSSEDARVSLIRWQQTSVVASHSQTRTRHFA
jgi:hypothetical protein